MKGTLRNPIFKDVVERVAKEIDHILKEGFVASPKDVNTVVIMGAG
jgi:hypothetical protein